MTKMAMMKLAASTLVLGTTMVGCAMSSTAQRPANVSEAKLAQSAAVAASRATKALAKKRAVAAVSFAEAAVAAQPRNADYRMLLGQAYLAAGRFQSAETSFTDTLTLDPNRERAALNLALAQIALGKTGEAKTTLGEYRERLSAADFGLAVALAGNPHEAVRILEVAARAPEADAKTRQNLALAYALDDQWANAKVLAMQDLGPAEVDVRLTQWASFAKPVGSSDQVASLLNVRPVTDGGQPARLALNASGAAVAEVEAPQPPAPVDDPVAVAMAVEAAQPTTVAEADPTPQPAFEIVQPTPYRAQPVAASRAAPRVVKASLPGRAASVRRVSAETGRFVVQLGAFSSTANAERAWNRAESRFSLASYDPVGGVARMRSGNLVRLSVGGFDTRGDALQVCGRIRSSGGNCFVRVAQNDAPAQWVSRGSKVRVASK